MCRIISIFRNKRIPEKQDMEKYSRYKRKSIDGRRKIVLCFRQRVPLSGNLLSDFPRHR